MTTRIDLEVAELLASRLCHDLVGPVGAVNNGMELLEEELAPGTAGDAVRLAAESAERAGAVLQFYRLAFGMAGSREEPDAAELRRLAAAWLARGKTELRWAEGPLPETAPQGLGKLLLNMIALGAEALPRGGAVAVEVRPAAAGVEARVTAAGAGAELREETRAGLDPRADLSALTPRNVQAYLAALLADRLGGGLAAEIPGPDTVILRASLTGG